MSVSQVWTLTAEGFRYLGWASVLLMFKPNLRLGLARPLLALTVPAMGVPSRAGSQYPSLSVIVVGLDDFRPHMVGAYLWDLPSAPIAHGGALGMPLSFPPGMVGK